MHFEAGIRLGNIECLHVSGEFMRVCDWLFPNLPNSVDSRLRRDGIIFPVKAEQSFKTVGFGFTMPKRRISPWSVKLKSTKFTNENAISSESKWRSSSTSNYSEEALSGHGHENAMFPDSRHDGLEMMFSENFKYRYFYVSMSYAVSFV